MVFRRVAVLGPGLLGGSLALDLSAREGMDLRLWGRRAEVLDEARARGVGGLLTTDLAQAVAGAELAVLCTPVEVMPSLARQIAALPDRPAMVTDVGSVKGMVEKETAPVLRAAGIDFVGSHPMCGSEQVGMAAARGGLFDGAMCLVVPRAEESPVLVRAVEGFWQQVGMRVRCLDEADHDEWVARVSHLPHAVAAVLAAVALEGCPQAVAAAAGGFRDSTRIAGGPVGMWTGILEANSGPVAERLRVMSSRLVKLAEALEFGRADEVRDALEAGAAARALLDAAQPAPDAAESP